MDRHKAFDDARSTVRTNMRRYSLDRDGYLKRLFGLEGQVRNPQRMTTDDEHCIDVLTQVMW